MKPSPAILCSKILRATRGGKDLTADELLLIEHVAAGLELNEYGMRHFARLVDDYCPEELEHQCQVRKADFQPCGYLARRREVDGQSVGWFCAMHWRERSQFFNPALELVDKHDVKVRFTYDDGFGGEYDVTATVRFVPKPDAWHPCVVEMEGLVDRDGGELERLYKSAEEQAIEIAWSHFDPEG